MLFQETPNGIMEQRSMTQDLNNYGKRQIKVERTLPNWAIVRKLIQNLQLFKSNLINFVYDIDARHIYPTAFNDINKVISCCIVSQSDISIMNSVFTAYCLHSVKVKICVGNC